MPIEQRVIAQPKIGGGAKIGGSVPRTEPVPDRPKGKKKRGKLGKKKLLLIVGPVLLLAIAAAAYFLVLAPKSGSAKPVVTPAPSPGLVVAVDAISLNLAEGHYLRIGIALQMTSKVATAKEAPATAKAIDAAITLFSGHTVAEISDPATRERLRAELEKTLEKEYDGEVMGVYFTNYVTS